MLYDDVSMTGSVGVWQSYNMRGEHRTTFI
jgi:hypothetical protein